MINSFSGPYEFLSNFYNCPVTAWGITYRNSESAFQAQKTKDEEIRKEFSNLNPSQGKLKGRNIELREDWEEVKDSVMYRILKNKFCQNKNLFIKLMNTGDEELIEGNWWHDNYWGDCYCDKCKDIKGQNKLGTLLMNLRDNFKRVESPDYKTIYCYDCKWGGDIK